MAGKGKKGKSKEPKEPVIVRGQMSVRDCMTWHYQNGYVPSNAGTPQPESGGGQDFYLASKPDLGRAKSRGYDIPPTHMQEQEDDGKVIDALRGWPHDQREEFTYDEPAVDMTQNGGGGDGKKGKDPWMGDLISHKFMNDAVRKRLEEEAAAAEASSAAAKKANPGPNDIRGNRTQQLRNIALAQKVEVNPRDLWQMSKFQKNARPHLTTVGKKAKAKSENSRQGSRKGSAMSQNEYGAGNGDPCTCYEYDPKTYDIERSDSAAKYDGPVNNEMDTYDFLNADFGGTKIDAL